MTAPFWPKVDLDGPVHPYDERLGKCWLYTGHASKSGYGQFYVDAYPIRAHRYAYEQCVRTLRPGELVRHSCDRRLCCRPSHLEAGTHADNMRDMVSRRRSARGERHGNCHITDSEVAWVRYLAAEGCKQAEIVRLTGIARYNVSRIVLGRVRNGFAREPGEEQ